jgi:hypothetical protein
MCIPLYIYEQNLSVEEIAILMKWHQNEDFDDKYIMPYTVAVEDLL